MKKKLIIIDMEEWCTQTEKAALTGMRLNTISQQVKRALAGQPAAGIVIKHIPELNITLVKR